MPVAPSFLETKSELSESNKDFVARLNTALLGLGKITIQEPAFRTLTSERSNPSMAITVPYWPIGPANALHQAVLFVRPSSEPKATWIDDQINAWLASHDAVAKGIYDITPQNERYLAVDQVLLIAQLEGSEVSPFGDAPLFVVRALAYTAFDAVGSFAVLDASGNTVDTIDIINKGKDWLAEGDGYATYETSLNAYVGVAVCFLDGPPPPPTFEITVNNIGPITVNNIGPMTVS